MPSLSWQALEGEKNYKIINFYTQHVCHDLVLEFFLIFSSLSITVFVITRCRYGSFCITKKKKRYGYYLIETEIFFDKSIMDKSKI